MLNLEGVSKSFGATVAVSDVDLSVPAGRTSVLLGLSGCGKSTLLRLMIGLLKPDAGRILFEGDPLTVENIASIRHRMGYVIQDGGLFPHLTARRNAALMADYLGWEARRIDHRIAELAELTRFPIDGLDRYPAQLSGGQRQRVGLMRALMLDPHLMLLDEPMAALDPMIRRELQEEIRGIFRRLKKTVVLVTHDIAEAGFLGDSIILLSQGRIVQQGTLEDLVRRPDDPFVTQFINAQRTPLDSLAEGES